MFLVEFCEIGSSLFDVLVQEEVLEGLGKREGEEGLFDPPPVNWEVPCNHEQQREYNYGNF